MAKEISVSAIRKSLKTKFIGKKIIYRRSLDSTMVEARREAEKSAKEGTVIIAGKQTEGRGRLQRKWLSPEGNIALSILLYPALADLPYLIMIASLAAAHAVKEISGLEAEIKWPNDILIGGKKAGGILIENKVSGSRVEYAVTGIGINTALKVADYNEIAETAVSLGNDAGEDLRAEIIASLLNEYERLYLTLPDGKPIYEAWRDRLVTLGKKVKALSGSQTIEGVAEAVDEDGALLIRGANGTVTKVVAGDVTLRG
jgi:BirA family transcriptional regulator, biotin operon repressor / biotin---[acetyl-CoA-carboxylase] ligase